MLAPENRVNRKFRSFYSLREDKAESRGEGEECCARTDFTEEA
jgi:hypothetical protein